jgi:hypothetical protein
MLFWQIKPPITSIITLCLVTLVFFGPSSSFNPKRKFQIGLKLTKINELEYQIAQEAIRQTPYNQTILAPEEVSSWITTFEDRRFPVAVRKIYLEHFTKTLGEETLTTRKLLLNWVSSSRVDTDDDTIRMALKELCVGSIVARQQDISAGVNRIMKTTLPFTPKIETQQEGYSIINLTTMRCD